MDFLRFLLNKGYISQAAYDLAQSQRDPPGHGVGLQPVVRAAAGATGITQTDQTKVAPGPSAAGSSTRFLVSPQSRRGSGSCGLFYPVLVSPQSRRRSGSRGLVCPVLVPSQSPESRRSAGKWQQDREVGWQEVGSQVVILELQ